MNQLNKNAGSVKTAGNSSKPSLNVYSLCFAYVALQSLLSYPAYLIFGSQFCEYVELFAGGPKYMAISYLATVASFLFIYLSYRLLPCRSLVCAFQSRPFQASSQSYYVQIWLFLSGLMIMNCALLFHQSGYILPLLQGHNLDAFEYSVYRSEITAGLSVSLANVNAHILGPNIIFISFACMNRGAMLFRIGSISLLLVSACFSLNRSFLPVTLLIVIFIFVAFKPVYFKQALKLIIPVFGLVLVAFSLVIYSTKADIPKATSLMTDRIIHGQWLGMPLYLYYFEEHKASPTTFVHPALRRAMGIETSPTPGRELMEYFNPAGVEAGSAGNIPTYFIGEAYAVAGWGAVCASAVYVVCIVWGFSIAFAGLPKNAVTCSLQGWIAYKTACGLLCGISAFLLSSLTLILLGLFAAGFFYDEATRTLGHPKRPDLSSVTP